MKMVSGALAAVMLAGIFWSATASAQAVPPGSYLRSCASAGLRGDSLIATCRRADGLEQRSVLADVHRCVGDIGNNNGVLQCQHAGGRQEFGQVVSEPGPGYGSDRPDRCGGLHRQSEELRARLDREWNPMERARIESHLRELHEQEERCR